MRRRNREFEAVVHYNWLLEHWPSVVPYARDNEDLGLFYRIGRYWQDNEVPRTTRAVVATWKAA